MENIPFRTANVFCVNLRINLYLKPLYINYVRLKIVFTALLWLQQMHGRYGFIVFYDSASLEKEQKEFIHFSKFLTHIQCSGFSHVTLTLSDILFYQTQNSVSFFYLMVFLLQDKTHKSLHYLGGTAKRKCTKCFTGN